MENVILNVYDLVAEPATLQSPQNSSQTTANNNQRQQQQSALSTVTSLFSNILTPLGFGAYHTSIDVRNFRYTFGPSVGITRTSSSSNNISNAADSQRYVPSNGAFRESIILGQTRLDIGEINQIVHRMRSNDENGMFKGENYHMANRNCNHFSETFAMALIMGNELLSKANDDNLQLKSYPSWINRLARTGTALGIDDGKSCHVVKEARAAVGGLKGKVGWDFECAKTHEANGKVSHKNGNNSNSRKKELTEKQKAALAKLKKNSKK